VISDFVCFHDWAVEILKVMAWMPQLHWLSCDSKHAPRLLEWVLHGCVGDGAEDDLPTPGQPCWSEIESISTLERFVGIQKWKEVDDVAFV